MKKILFVSPTLQPDEGGIQVCGRLALRCLAEHARERNRPLHHLAYGSDPSDGSVPLKPVRYHPVSSRLEAVRTSLSLRSRNTLTIFWHLDLLKLYPFLHGSGGSALLYLFGLEAWQPFGWVTRWLLRRMDRLISISRFTWNRFVEENPGFRNAKHEVVHLGIGKPVDPPIRSPEDPPTGLMLGRLSRDRQHNKGHEEVIRAWPAVRKELPRARLWIAGKGKRREALEKLAGRLGLGDSIKFWGWVSEDKKEELLDRARCLILPSRGEGFGLVYLEAMRRERPCLVSPLDAGREVVNPPEAGLAVDPRDEEELSRGILELLTPGEAWQKKSTQARLRYENNFTRSQFFGRFSRSLSPFW